MVNDKVDRQHITYNICDFTLNIKVKLYYHQK